MADPVTSGIASAIAGGAIDQIRNYINNSENPQESWREAACECVVQARASIRNYDIKLGDDYHRMKSKIGQIGESADQIAERGDMRGFDDDLVDLLRNFARACLEYASSSSVNNYNAEEEFIDKIDDIGGEIEIKTEDSV
jgi:hypothetical protein